MNTLFSLRLAHVSKRKLYVILALALLAVTLAFGGGSFASTAHAASITASSKAVISPNVACPATIKEGSTGSSVKKLQGELNEYYGVYFTDYPDSYNTPLKVDGKFGSQTRDAVIDFQYWQGLAVDGIVGPKTWAVLGNC